MILMGVRQQDPYDRALCIERLGNETFEITPWSIQRTACIQQDAETIFGGKFNAVAADFMGGTVHGQTEAHVRLGNLSDRR
jgi:hypothetical protein